MRKLFPLLILVLLGCGVNPGKNPDPVDVSGRVTLRGAPVNDVNFNFQPTGSGTPAVLPIKNGEFRGKVTPGRYTYYITQGSKAASLKAIPETYHAGSMERQIDVSEGTTLDIKLD